MYNDLYNQQLNYCYERNLNVVKDYFKGRNTLILAILLAVNAVMGLVISIVMAATMIPSIMNSAYSGNPDGGSFSFNFNTGSFGGIFGILAIVAFFIIYQKSKNPDLSSNPKSGFTLLYVVSVIGLVFTCLGIGLFIIMGFLLFFVMITAVSQETGSYGFNDSLNHMAFGYTSPDTGIAIGIFVFVLVVGLAILAFTLIAQISQMKFYKSINQTLKTPCIPYVKGAKVFGVINIINAIFTFISCIGFIIVYFSFNDVIFDFLNDGISSGIPQIFSSTMKTYIIPLAVTILITVAIYVLYALMAFGYKKHIDTVTQGMSNPNFDVPQQVVAGYYQAPYGQNPVAAPQQPIDTYVQPQADTSEQGTVCPGCGCKVSENDRFCEQCGKDLYSSNNQG